MISTITSIAPDLGATPDGKSWCMKALHPSDGSVEVRGIPDRSSVPSVMVNYQTTSRLGPPTDAADSWSFDAQITPHPVSFGFWASRDANSVHSDAGGFLNSQLDGATHAAKMSSFLSTCERWRLAYMGVSIHFDGPALSNQGSIVCNQAPYSPRGFYACASDLGAPDHITAALSRVRMPDAVGGLHGSDYPDYDRSASMPNAYTGQVKDGLYVPIKLTKTCQQWHGASDLEVWVPFTANVFGNYALQVPTIGSLMTYPFYGLPGLAIAAENIVGGSATSPVCNDVVANICARNMSVQSALIFTFRVGFEVQVEPGTLLTPYQKVSPLYDPIALKSYSMVSRELKDAYPVEFNDLGKLWSVISGAIRQVQPMLNTINPIVGTLAGGVVTAGDAIRALARRGASSGKSRSGGASAETAPAAAKARQVEEVHRAMESQGPRRPKKQRGGGSSALPPGFLGRKRR